MSPTQLGLDLTPIGAFAVGDRVRLKPTSQAVDGFLSLKAGDAGTVTDVRPVCGPADRARCGGGGWNPVVVLMDDAGDSGREREYAFEHEELEVVLDDAVAVDGRAA